MKNTIERIQDSIDDIKTAINTKYLRNGEEAPIEDDTLLEEYALAIDNIPTETVDLSQQIFVFYCWATNEADAKSKRKPIITWNNPANKWSIECDPIGWNISADEEELDQNQPNAEKYLYAWFVSVNTNSNNTELPEPDPVRLTGKTGAKGEDGSDGRDGVIAGLTLRNIIPLYCFSDDIPSIQQNSATYQQPTNDLSKLFPKYIKINNVLVTDELALPSDPDKWRQAYNNTNNTNNLKLWTINVLYSSNNTATVLGNPVLVADLINIETKYSTSIESGADWQETPIVPSVDNQIIYKRTTITSDSGVERSTIDTLQYPKSIVGVTYKYGTSDSTESAPNEWRDTYPANTSDVVWIQRTETFSDGKSQTIEYPIGLRGPAGIQFIGSVESESDLSSISPKYDNDYIGKLGVRVGQDVYVWYGAENPNLPGVSEIGDWWLNVGPLSSIPDWNAQVEEPGYINNRTHYEYFEPKTITGRGGDASIPKKSANVAKIRYNGNETNIELKVTYYELSDVVIYVQDDDPYWTIFINDKTNGEGVSFEITYGEYKLKTLDPKFVPQMIEITYSDLKALKDTNQLVPGMQYRIIDYNTITIKENTKSAKHPFDLIVTADSVNEINCKARAIQSKRDSDGYFDESDLSKWEIWYDFDNRTNYDWIPKEDLEAGVYDGDTKYTLSTETVTGGDMWLMISESNDKEITVCKVNEGDFYVNVDGSDTIKYRVESNSNETDIFVPFLWNWWTSAEAYMEVGDRETFKLKVTIDSEPYIYNCELRSDKLRCLYNNTYEEYEYALLYNSNAPIGYRNLYIHPDLLESLFILCGDNSEYWVDLVNYSGEHYSDNYGLNLGTRRYTADTGWDNLIFPIVEENSYIQDNTIQHYTTYVADNIIHKGTIYRMIDEFRNDCPYDFKNIMFKGNNVYYYTFSNYDRLNNCLDYTLNRGEILCHDNVIKCYFDDIIGPDDRRLQLPSNIFKNNSDACYNNTFGNNCWDNIFGSGCCNNTFGNNCYKNNFSDDVCSYNIFSDNCYNNTFGNNCSYNHFASSSHNNTFGSNCHHNFVINSFNDNTLESNCLRNVFVNCCDFTYSTNTADNFFFNNNLPVRFN